MTRIIRIANCAECPNFNKMVHHWFAGWCSIKSGENTILDDEVIPSWCSLEKVYEPTKRNAL